VSTGTVPLRLRFLRTDGRYIPAGAMAPGQCCYLKHEPGKCWDGWEDCDGTHLFVMLPDGHLWDVDGRAGNCTMPGDRRHRCWVRTGDPEALPPTVTAGKDGPTCAAGAGSVQSPGGWHGFLHGGWLCLQRGQRGLDPPDPAPEEESTMPDAPAPVPEPAAPATPPQVPYPTPTTEAEHFANLEHVLRVRAADVQGYGHLWAEVADRLRAWREALGRDLGRGVRDLEHLAERREQQKEAPPETGKDAGSGA
jgi:hypothetical protein